MVIISVKDGDGKFIKNARINEYKSIPHEEYEVVIDNYHMFTREELILILNLIEKRVEYGNDVPTTKKYLDLYDKIEKIDD
jgi:hypothetical protein